MIPNKPVQTSNIYKFIMTTHVVGSKLCVKLIPPIFGLNLLILK